MKPLAEFARVGEVLRELRQLRRQAERELRSVGEER